jgi:hypothetical protein
LTSDCGPLERYLVVVVVVVIVCSVVGTLVLGSVNPAPTRWGVVTCSGADPEMVVRCK